jgi:hypothetical protein
VAAFLYRKIFFSSTRELSLQSVGEEELWYVDVCASKSGMDVDEEAIGTWHGASLYYTAPASD